ncbi:ubiquinol-cytochrome c reductase core subunit 1 [Tulasnella sp. 403]|nr:ubiquinol-cytochrome c reductase core subunit 1 [Tulasnella sp. 403]
MLSASLRASRGRAYATVASSTPNIASINYGQPTSSVTVLVKAGSRYETKPGVAHFLKNFAFKDTGKRSALRTVRETELFGGVLSSSISREYITLTADFLPGNEAYFVDVLASQLTSPRFARHEFIESVAPLVQGEATAAYNNPATLAVELAHSVAFRNGLGSSVFAPSSHHLTVNDVKEYASKVFSSGNIAVIGTGVDEALLKKLVDEHLAEAASGAAPTSTPTKYFGGETRVAPSPDSHSHGPQTVFIGYGSSSASPELAILSAYLDPTTSIKWAQSVSPIASALAPGATAQAVYLPYSDAALAGVVIQSHSGEALKTAASAVAKAIKDVKSGSLTGDAFNGAVAKAKFRAAAALEQKEAQVHALGSKLLGADQASLASLSSALEKVDAASFAKATSTITSSKPTFVAVGELSSLPYADEIGL